MPDNRKCAAIGEDLKVVEYSERLKALRKDGVRKVSDAKIELTSARKNKLIGEEERARRVSDLQKAIAEGKADALRTKDEVARIQKEAVAYVDAEARKIEAEVESYHKARMRKAKAYYQDEVARLRQAGQERRAEIKGRLGAPEDRAQLRSELGIADYELSSALFDARTRYRGELDKSKAAMNQAYVDHVQKNRELRNGKTRLAENMLLRRKSFVYNFSAGKFFLSNGLYLAIIVFFIVCIIAAPIRGMGNLLSLPNILTILEQASTRMFYALGVAGLILLTGTDLSIGRMVAMGSVVTGLILHPGTNIVTFFKLGPWNFTALPMAGRVLMALAISIVLCVAFSAFAGLFTAKLKMHPFISTLATQLIIYGILFFGTSGTPVGSIESSIKDFIGGRWILGVAGGQLVTFPKLVIPAIAATIVAWFIWNKTTFGKNMYAVGGNPEAAAVSGISVFWVTMGVFIMAGVFYGCGSFLEAFRANASAGTGQGFELDAIAACVVGGISFNGGIGKISGAVLGVIIFTSLTYCLTFLGVDTNLQFVFKGFIILAAVSLDSIKYLKKK